MKLPGASPNPAEQSQEYFRIYVSEFRLA